ncbi:MAG: tyrosine-type recombinase/integrase [Chloroflexi bacterium]|nr:tyrosine-type recombinase/integrase [Chloroflexota bacterium]MDA8186833.1 tyrosine-type recombinase/integrase [Dehalococcoidales bacterium]
MKKKTNILILNQENTLIADALDEFMLALRAGHRSERTVEGYYAIVTRFIWWSRRAHCGEHIQDIQANHIRLFVQYLQTSERRWQSDAPQSQKRCCDATVATYFRHLRAFFNFCERERFIDESPFRNGRLETPKVRQKLIPSYAEDDISAILTACKTLDTGNSLRDTAIVYLMLDTGVRASELCEARLQDLERGRMKVLGKGNKERYLIMCPTTEKAVRDYIRKERADVYDDHIFLGRGGKPIVRNGLYQIIQRRARQAGLNVKGLHKFRHTFALRWAESGGPLHALQALLGHESPAMSLKYGRMSHGNETANLHRQHSPVESLQLKSKRRK